MKVGLFRELRRLRHFLGLDRRTAKVTHGQTPARMGTMILLLQKHGLMIGPLPGRRALALPCQRCGWPWSEHGKCTLCKVRIERVIEVEVCPTNLAPQGRPIKSVS